MSVFTKPRWYTYGSEESRSVFEAYSIRYTYDEMAGDTIRKSKVLSILRRLLGFMTRLEESSRFEGTELLDRRSDLTAARRPCFFVIAVFPPIITGKIYRWVRSENPLNPFEFHTKLLPGLFVNLHIHLLTYNICITIHIVIVNLWLFS